MRKKIINFSLSFVMIGLITSCTYDRLSEENVTKKFNFPPPVNPVVFINADKLTYDESFKTDRTRALEGNSKRYIAPSKRNLDSPFSNSVNSTLQSEEMVITSPNRIYVGAVYDAKSLTSSSYKPIMKPVKPITISFSFPTENVSMEIESPSLSSMRKSVIDAIKSEGFSGKQSVAFDYDMKKFERFEELKIAFGANVNIGSIFSMDISSNFGKSSKKTSIFAKVTQKFFTVDMDYPKDGNIFVNDSELISASESSPVYINSVTYGRLGIIIIESDENTTEVSSALKTSLELKKGSAGTELSTEYKKILKNSEIKVFVLGGNGESVSNIITGFEGFSEFIQSGGEFSIDNPGVPISFKASHATDNSIFHSTFVVQNDILDLQKCGAYIAPGVWREFMCHNLGANTKTDPFKFSKEIYGDKYQWGKRAPILTQTEDQEKLQVMDWNKTPAPSDSWDDYYKKSDDPCPTGYRVPTELNWKGVIDNNPHTKIGTWVNSPTNYSSGIFFYREGVPTLMLPAAGFRWDSTGDLSYHGENAIYWSSTIHSNDRASRLYVRKDRQNTGSSPFIEGASIRCIKEN